jgi:hypothetical protein
MRRRRHQIEVEAHREPFLPRTQQWEGYRLETAVLADLRPRHWRMMSDYSPTTPRLDHLLAGAFGSSSWRFGPSGRASRERRHPNWVSMHLPGFFSTPLSIFLLTQARGAAAALCCYCCSSLSRNLPPPSSTIAHVLAHFEWEIALQHY